MVRLFFAAVAAAGLSLIGALPAQAQCMMPDVPVVPDGAVAAEEDMVESFNQIRAFQAEVATYRECLDEEMATAKAEFDRTESSAAEDRFDALQDNYNDSVDAEQELGAEFNAQYGIWKARNE